MKKWSIRIILGVLALVVLALLGMWLFLRASLPQLEGQVREAGMVARVSVERDDHGVPMFKGTHRNDMAYATGFIHAQDRFFQMDLLRRSGAGELAELFGPKALEMDKSRRMYRFRARAEQVLAAMSAADRAFLDRYVAGVNDGLNALGARPFEYGMVNVAPRPWTAADSLLVVWAMYFDLQGNLENREAARGWLRQNATPEQLAVLVPEATSWDAPLDAEAVEHKAPPFAETAPAWWGAAPRADAPTRLASADFVDAVGSNNWAVAGTRSRNGAAIVADDMHLGISLPNTWYRLAMEFPGADGKQRRVVGVTLPGAPIVVVGSNGKVAWGYTNSYGDYLDLVVLGDSDKITEVEETILVKGAPAEKFIVRESDYGPVRALQGRNVAMHWVAQDKGAVNLNLRRMEEVSTLEEALDVATTLGIPAQNFVAGDSAGNIGWTIAGLLPQREAHGVGSTFPIAADDPLMWKGVVAPADYPRVVNPASGQISTANSRQLDGAGARVIGDGGFDLGARANQIRKALADLGASTDVKGVYGVMLDDRALFIGTWRERILKVLDAEAVKDHPARAELRSLVEKSWDGRASTSSVGYRLSRHMMWAMHDLMFDGANAQLANVAGKADMHTVSSRWPALMARLIDEQPAGWLPKGHADWRAVQLAAIDRVIADQTRDGKKLADATWGARNTAGFAHPISRAVPALKSVLGTPPDQLPGDANMPRVAGPTFGQSERLTVSPGHEEEGIFNMPGGQSGHPLSPFFLKGHEDWVKGTPRPLLPGAAKYVLTFSR